MPYSLDTYAESAASNPSASATLEEKFDSVVNQTKKFIDEVAMPGVYRLPEVFEFKWVLWSLLATFIVLVTLLTIIPMKVITNETTRAEAFRRSLGIARNLAQTNERAIRQDDMQKYSVNTILREEGLVEAYIISKEGLILAPPERVGMVPKEIEFARRIRMQPREFVETLKNGHLIAAVPILIFDPELQQNAALAHAVVVYDSASLAFGDERVLSLFIQMLTIALILGTVLFFVLYKLLEYPLKSLNQALDRALRQENLELKLDFKFPVVQQLVINLNSLIHRANSAQSVQQEIPSNPLLRQQEVFSLMDLMGYPCILLDAYHKIIRPNSLFESLTGLSSSHLAQQTLEVIPDQAMQQNFEFLMRQAAESQDKKSQDSLELSGHQFRLQCQVLLNPKGDPEFYLIVIAPEQGHGVAA
jgi:PAS domain-containing protein